MTTETTGQHTPTPWDLQTLRVSLVPVMIRVNGYTKETAEANAAFICRACNSHDALVGALQSLFEHCAMVHKCWGDSDNTKEADAAIKRAESAIAAATKE